MSKIQASIQVFETSIGENLKFLDWLDEEISKEITHATAGSASTTREDSAPDFWTKHYNKKAGRTNQVSLFYRYGSDWANARYKDGRRVVHFKVDAKNKLKKEVTLTATTMNMYENDATIPVGKSWRKAPYVRPGTHIFSSRITAIAKSAIVKNIQKFNEKIDELAKKRVK